MSTKDPNYQKLQRWERWIEAHQQELEHVVGFEERFVRDILTYIPILDPEDLIAQYPFYDRNGRRRRVDFMILNENKGYALAIEIDGLNKITEREDPYEAYTDMLLRQNDLLKRLQCLLLRFSNKEWLYHTDSVISEISQSLQQQAQNHKKLQEQAQKDTQEKTKLHTLEEEINNLKALQESQSSLNKSLSLNIKEHEKLIDKIKNLEAEISKIKAQDTKAQKHATDSLQEIVADAEFNFKHAQTSTQASRFPKKALWLLTLLPLLILAYIFLPQENLNVEPQEKPSTQKVVSAPLSTTQESFRPVVNQNSHRAYTSTNLSSNITLSKSPSISQKTYLTPSETLLHLGETAIVCGRLSEIFFAKNRTFLNFEASFPDNIFTVVIEDANVTHFKGINQHLHQKLCVQGLIEPYAKRALINLKEKKQWLHSL